MPLAKRECNPGFSSDHQVTENPDFFYVYDWRLLIHRFVQELRRIDRYTVDAHFPV